VEAVFHLVPERGAAKGFLDDGIEGRLVFLTEDAKEGPRAFMEKRTPVYQGR
jgi:enoyl-CoA hydratase